MQQTQPQNGTPPSQPHANDTPPSEADEEPVRYDETMQSIQVVTAGRLAQEIEDVQEKIEEAKKEEKDEEEAKIKALNQKSPDFSLGWTIGDTRCYMIILQIMVIVSCALVLLLSFDQMADESECTENKYLCLWPTVNTITRSIGAVFGLVSGIVTIILLFFLGSAILRDMKSHNDSRKKADKLEFFDVYSVYFIFKIMRFVIGVCGYLQFIAVGLDTYAYLVASGDDEYRTVIFISVVVAVLLRISHDSMYQRVYKRKFQFNVSFNSDKGYAGATVVDKEAGGQIVEMGDTHHIAATHQSDIMTAEQKIRFLEQQNKILAATASTYAPSVYSDVSGTGIGHNHLNTQSLKQFNLQNTVPSGSGSGSQY